MLLIVYVLICICIRINGNDQFHLGIVNHNTQWHFHCPQNHTDIETPPQEYQPLISYQCPLPSSSIDILPIEIEFTFLCRFQSRLLWIIIDLYQYYSWPWSIDDRQIDISLELNRQIPIVDMVRGMNNLKNRSILTTAYYIPFESIELLANDHIEFRVLISNSNLSSQCQFDVRDLHRWSEFIHQNCNVIESKTFQMLNGKCDFFPIHYQFDPIFSESITTPANPVLGALILEETTSIPDFNVILSIEEESIETTTTTTMTTRINISRFQADNQLLLTVSFYPNTTSTNLLHPHSLFDEHYRQLLVSLAATARTEILLKLSLIFSMIVLILLVIFFLYLICYHCHSRSQRSIRQHPASIPI